MADQSINQLVKKIDELISSLKSGGAKSQSDKVDTASYSLMERLRSATRDKYELDEKSYEALKKQHQALEDNVKLLEEEGEIEEEILKKQKARLDKAKKELDTLKDQAKVNEKRIDSEKSLLSLQGKLTNGIKSRLGLEINSDKVQKSISNTLIKGGSNAKALAAGMGSFLTQSISAVNTTKLLIEGFNFLHTQFKQIDNDTRDLAKSLNLTYKEAEEVRDQLTNSALATKALKEDLSAAYATGKSFSKSMVEMNSQLGTSARFENERLATYTKLRDVAKFEAEVLEDINRMSFASNQTQKDVTKNRLAQINLSKIQLGRQIDERKVMQDIAKASYNIKINYLGRDRDLAKAATQARALGMELSQTERIAESLMDFEGSIQKQMEAELLTGRSLNLERARYFALTNDLTGLQTELNRQGITAEKFGKMNRIQQTAIAGAMGMSKDEMSKMLVEQKALQNLGVGSLEAAQKEYELAVKNGTVEEYKKKLGDDSLARQFQQQSLQERMNMAVEKMLSAFEKLAIVFRPLYKLLNGFLDIIILIEEKVSAISRLFGVIATKKIGNMAGDVAKTAATQSTSSIASGMSASAFSKAGPQVLNSAGTQLFGAAAKQGLKSGSAVATGGAESLIKAGGSRFGSGVVGNLLSGSIGKIFKFLLKAPVISSVIETIFANKDIEAMMASGEKGPKLNQAVGKRAVQAVGSVGGGALAGALVAGTSALGLPSWLFTTLITSAGAGLGSYLAGLAADKIGVDGIGKMIVDYKNEPKLKDSDVPGLATGGVVEKTGLIKAHAGEVYTGGGTLKMFEGMWQEMKNQNQQLKEQNKYLAAIANKSTVLQLDRQVLATEMGKEVAMSYGNILNPGSQTFS